MNLKVGVVGLGRGRVYLDRFSKQSQVALNPDTIGAEVVAVLRCGYVSIGGSGISRQCVKLHQL